MINLTSLIFLDHAGCRGMQFAEDVSNFDKRQVYRLNAEPTIEPRSTLCFSKRYIAGINSEKLLVELTTHYINKICSQLLLS